MLPFEDINAPEADQDRYARFRSWVFVLVAVIILLSLAATAFRLRDEYNPFWESTPEFREAQALAATIHTRSLSDAEFNRALELCEVGHVQARADAVSIVEESVKRNPVRGESAVQVMKRVARARNARLKDASERLLERIEGRLAPK